jgi:hypothetical protein
MSDQPRGKIVDDVQQRRKIEDVFDEAVHRARGPCAIAVAAQVERVDVVTFPQRTRDPVPIAGVVQAAMDQHQRGLPILPVIPELQLQPVRIEKV